MKHLSTLKPFGEHCRLHHIGVVVNQITGPKQYDPLQGVHIQFVSIYDTLIEFIEYDSPDKDKSKPYIAHYCFEVPNIKDAIEKGREAGFHRFSTMQPASAFNNRLIVWLFHEKYGVIELLEGM